MYLTKKLSAVFLACGVIFSANVVQAQEPNRPECIAPAQPGGGFDLTCRIAVNSFQNSDLLNNPMRTIYMTISCRSVRQIPMRLWLFQVVRY